MRCYRYATLIESHDFANLTKVQQCKGELDMYAAIRFCTQLSLTHVVGFDLSLFNELADTDSCVFGDHALAGVQLT